MKKLRAKLHYPRYNDYWKPESGIGPTVVAPAILEDILIIGLIDLLCAGVGASASAVKQLARWLEYKNHDIEIYERGVLVISPLHMAISWGDIKRVRVYYSTCETPRSIHIWTKSGYLTIDNNWPGLNALVDAVVEGANLKATHNLHDVDYVPRRRTRGSGPGREK